MMEHLYLWEDDMFELNKENKPKKRIPFRQLRRAAFLESIKNRVDKPVNFVQITVQSNPAVQEVPAHIFVTGGRIFDAKLYANRDCVVVIRLKWIEERKNGVGDKEETTSFYKEESVTVNIQGEKIVDVPYDVYAPMNSVLYLDAGNEPVVLSFNFTSEYVAGGVMIPNEINYLTERNVTEGTPSRQEHGKGREVSSETSWIESDSIQLDNII